MSRSLIRYVTATNQLQDLDAAITTGHKGLATLEGYREGEWQKLNMVFAHEMAIQYTRRLERSRHRADAEKALGFCKTSVELSPPATYERGSALSQQASVLDALYLATGDQDYLKQAVSTSQEALPLIHDSAQAHYNLANQLERMYSVKAETDILQDAVKHINRALAVTPNLPGRRAVLGAKAGSIYKTRYEKTGSDADYAMALSYLTDVFRQAEGPPLVKINAARRAVELLGKDSRWEEAWVLLHDALGFIPKLCPVHMPPGDQQHIISMLGGLASESCSAAIACGRVAEGLEDLERGRGIMVASSHRALSDLDALGRDKPNLFKKYCQIRNRLLRASDEKVALGGSGGFILTDRRSILAIKSLEEEMDRVLQDIQSVHGFDRFLHTLSAAEMQSLCRDSAPVVVLNWSKHGSHAILVTPARIWAMPLPDPPNTTGFTRLVEPMATRVLERLINPLPTAENLVEENNMLLELLTISGITSARPWRTPSGSTVLLVPQMRTTSSPGPSRAASCGCPPVSTRGCPSTPPACTADSRPTASSTVALCRPTSPVFACCSSRAALLPATATATSRSRPTGSSSVCSGPRQRQHHDNGPSSI